MHACVFGSKNVFSALLVPHLAGDHTLPDTKEVLGSCDRQKVLRPNIMARCSRGVQAVSSVLPVPKPAWPGQARY